MKKMTMLLMIALVGSNSKAFEDLHSTSNDTIAECQDNNCFLDARSLADEYESTEEIRNDFDEYDHNISDSVQPPKISPVKEMLAKVLGALLVRYISVRETARIYFKEFKEIITQWYNRITTAQ